MNVCGNLYHMHVHLQSYIVHVINERAMPVVTFSECSITVPTVKPQLIMTYALLLLQHRQLCRLCAYIELMPDVKARMAACSLLCWQSCQVQLC